MKIEICYFNKDGKHYCGMAAILHYAKEHEIDVSKAIARFEDCDQPDNETVNVEQHLAKRSYGYCHKSFYGIFYSPNFSFG